MFQAFCCSPFYYKERTEKVRSDLISSSKTINKTSLINFSSKPSKSSLSAMNRSQIWILVVLSWMIFSKDCLIFFCFLASSSFIEGSFSFWKWKTYSITWAFSDPKLSLEKLHFWCFRGLLLLILFPYTLCSLVWTSTSKLVTPRFGNSVFCLFTTFRLEFETELDERFI